MTPRPDDKKKTTCAAAAASLGLEQIDANFLWLFSFNFFSFWVFFFLFGSSRERKLDGKRNVIECIVYLLKITMKRIYKEGGGGGRNEVRLQFPPNIMTLKHLI